VTTFKTPACAAECDQLGALFEDVHSVSASVRVEFVRRRGYPDRRHSERTRLLHV
jgi:hypothetical protein